MSPTADTYETHAKGTRILPGQWRPHYPWEQIAWVSPPWPSQDYLWLDFPEALFSAQGVLYLSHVNPKVPVLFPDLPKVPWRTMPDGLVFERDLPNGVRFGGSLRRRTESRLALELHLENASPDPLTDIMLQTCTFLRAIEEFSDFTMDNKYVHLPGRGWLPWPEATAVKQEAGRYRLGWRRGPAAADLPVMACLSSQPGRLVAMTWGEHTYSLIGNPRYPCLHADPRFPDLPAGQKASIQGELIFVEGGLDDLARALSEA